MRPYIICHMVASIDGRIDCEMVEKISGEEYDLALEQLDCPTLLEGRVTMEHYYAAKEPFVAGASQPIGNSSLYRAEASDAYVVAVDTSGRLRWHTNRIDDVPLICLTSERASEAYFEMLHEQGISWIAVGRESIDLRRAMELLGEQFEVRRQALLGGGHINGGFLKAGLIDEVSLLLAPGIDGRTGETALFDGVRHSDRVPVPLRLRHVSQLDNDVVWLRYDVRN